MQVLTQIHARLLLQNHSLMCSLTLWWHRLWGPSFSQILNPNIFSWNSMIRDCSQIQIPSREPINQFKRLVKRGYPCPNSFTLAFISQEGRQVRMCILWFGFGSNPFVQTTLVNFYAKCKDIGLSKKVFDEISERNFVFWTMECNDMWVCKGSIGQWGFGSAKRNAEDGCWTW